MFSTFGWVTIGIFLVWLLLKWLKLDTKHPLINIIVLSIELFISIWIFVVFLLSIFRNEWIFVLLFILSTLLPNRKFFKPDDWIVIFCKFFLVILYSGDFGIKEFDSLPLTLIVTGSWLASILIWSLFQVLLKKEIIRKK